MRRDARLLIAEELRRIWYLINRRRLERELLQDMEAHRKMMREPHRFGNTLRLREESRDAWGWNSIDDFWTDLRLASRNLGKAWGFTIGAVALLSLGLGMNLTIFQIFDATKLRPLSVRDVDSLVRLNWNSKGGRSRNVPYPAVETIQSHNSVFSAILTTYPTMAFVDGSQRFQTMFVSTNWFDELGYSAAIGRVFHEGADDRSEAAPVVVVSHRFWKWHLDGKPNSVGQTIRVNDQPAVLIGIAPENFPGLDVGNPQVWIPINRFDYFNRGGTFTMSWNESVSLYGRLRPGTSSNAVRDATRSVFAALSDQHPTLFQKDDWLEPISGTVRFRSSVQIYRDRVEFAAIGSLAGLILMIACANLGNLILSRSVGRVRELSIRVALGASGARVVRHLLTESFLLSTMGVAGASIVSYWSLSLYRAIADVPPADFLSIDWKFLFVSVVASPVVTMVLGLIPALKIGRRDLIAAIKDGGQQTTASLESTQLRSRLVAVQVGGTCVLLMIAGLMVRGFQQIRSDPGYEIENLAVLDLSRGQYGLKEEEARTYWAKVRETLAANPETEGLSLVSAASMGKDVTIFTTPDAAGLRITGTQVDPAFFEVMKIPFLAGRTFQEDDDPRTTIIISKRVASLMYGTLDVLGRGYPKSQPTRTIVGVVHDARVVRLDDVKGAQYYLPITDKGLRLGALVVRAKNNVEKLLTPMRNAARLSDDRFIPEVRLLTADYDELLRSQRNAGLVVGALASLALFLAGIGIFSVMSYGAALRRKEIGIRLALGANDQAIIRILTLQLSSPVFVAMLTGLSLGLLITRSLALKHPELFAPFEPILLIVVGLIVVVTTATAALIPTFRALRVDILQTLRYE